MSARFGLGDSRVKVNSFTTPRKLRFLGDVTISEDVANDRFDITVTGGGGGGGGTVQSASNVGSGEGWFKQLNVADLEFKSAVAGSAKITIVSNTNDLTFDIDEASINIANLGGSIQDSQLSSNVAITNNTITFTNKTINLTNNTVTDTSTAAGDLAKSNGTKFLRFAKGTALQLLRTNSGATDLEWGAVDDSMLSANVTILTSSQTLTNKTINLTNNTVTDSSTAAGDLAKSNGTKFVRFARGNAGEILRTNTGGTDLEYAAPTSFKLDDWGTPDDNTDLNASTSRHGLLRKLDNDTDHFLRGDGSWASVPGVGDVTGGAIGGNDTQSGDASTKVFTIAHGFGMTPNAAHVQASSVDALGEFSTDVDDTNITITYQIAPPDGTDNLSWYWIIQADGSGVGDVTLAATQTLTNKTIDLSLNTLKHIGTPEYVVYFDNSDTPKYTARDNRTGLELATGATLDAVLPTVLSTIEALSFFGSPYPRGGTVRIGGGTHTLSGSMAGFDIPEMTTIEMPSNCIIVVPQDYSGYVFKMNGYTSGQSSASIRFWLKGGYIKEAGTPGHLWDGLLMQCNDPDDSAALYGCVVEDTTFVNALNGIHLKTTDTNGLSYINGCMFRNLVFNNCVNMVNFDQNGMPLYPGGIGFTGRNEFYSLVGQSGADSLVGFKDITGNNNIFIGCKVWDAPGGAVTSNVTAAAFGTMIIGGIMTAQNYTDLGVNTWQFDDINGFKPSAIKIRDSDNSHTYNVTPSNLAANRNVTLPLLGGNDEFTFNAHTQTLTNKTLTSPVINSATIASATTTGTFTLDSTGTTFVEYVKPFTNSVAELLVKWRLSEDTTSYASLENFTSTNGVFAPNIVLRQASSASFAGGRYTGMIQSGNDSGSVAAVIIEGKTNAGALGTRPIASIYNWTTEEYQFGITTADWKDNNLVNVSYQDFTRIAAPSDPAANKARIYCKQKDSNNDGLFVKQKIGGTITEVELAVADDVLSINELSDVTIASPAANEALVYQTGSATFENKKLKCRAFMATQISTTSLGTRFIGWGASQGSTTTEANAETTVNTAFTVKRVYVKISTNTADQNTTFSIRKNGGNVTGSTHTVAAGVTTAFDSGEITGSYVAGDEICVMFDKTTSSTGNTVALVTVEYEMEAFV